jgi:hypothetical protein
MARPGDLPRWSASPSRMAGVNEDEAFVRELAERGPYIAESDAPGDVCALCGKIEGRRRPSPIRTVMSRGAPGAARASDTQPADRPDVLWSLYTSRGGAPVARWAHNPKVAGSIPAPATPVAGAHRNHEGRHDHQERSKRGLRAQAPVAQRIERMVADHEAGGSSPSGRTKLAGRATLGSASRTQSGRGKPPGASRSTPR